MAIASPGPRREPPGYQQAPHLLIIVVCGLGAVLLALIAGIVDFTLGQNPSPTGQTVGPTSVVAHDASPSAVGRP
ncbi:MAG TPA: hypothetical protein VGM10_30895 [Actinocrinis sp.]|jgi:hypothetical protein